MQKYSIVRNMVRGGLLSRRGCSGVGKSNLMLLIVRCNLASLPLPSTSFQFTPCSLTPQIILKYGDGVPVSDPLLVEAELALSIWLAGNKRVRVPPKGREDKVISFDHRG